MARTHALTTERDLTDIHRCTTRILRGQRDTTDDRKTLLCESTFRGAACTTCTFAEGAQFCGMCGERAGRRASLVGKVVDDLYDVELELAEGETATIYRARYLPSGQEVALKVLHPELSYDSIAVARFRREGKVLARLRNTHTVAVYDHGETADGTVYIAMELLHGEGLDARVRTRGAMPWRTVLSVMRDVCSSLVEAHAHGIVHRDLTPTKIRIEPNNDVKLIDFGLAKVRPDADDDELTSAGKAVGTLQYMAPEQVIGHTCDGRADLYALGVIGLELLLGHVRRPNAAVAVLPASIPREVETLLLRCLAPEPSDRIPNAAELEHEISRILASSEPLVPVPSATPQHVFAHTSAFELQPPRIVLDIAPLPRFLAARGSEPEIEIEIGNGLPANTPRRFWRLMAAAFVMGGIGVATAIAGCV